MNPTEERGFFDRDFEYIYVPPGGQLTPNQVLNDQVAIDVDADFFSAAWYQNGDSVYEITVTDSDGSRFSNVPLQSGSIPIVISPQVFTPAHRFPAGGKIQVNIRELAGATSDLQIVFKGWKRFEKPVQQQ